MVPEGQLLARAQVSKAVECLKKYVDSSESAQSNLIGKERLSIQFAYKKIPRTENKLVTIPLEHKIDRDSSEVCLIVKDLDKKEKDYADTVHHFQDLLKQHSITCVGEVIPLKCLRLEYRPFEAKRRLAERFSMFLADARVAHLLPKVLGKHVYGKKKTPVSIDMEAKNLPRQFEKALSATRVTVNGLGSSSLVCVGDMDMEASHLVDNVMTAAAKVASAIPGGQANVRNMYLKTPSSPALPVYISRGEASEVTLPPKEKAKEEDEAEDVTTIVGAKVIVTKDGTVKLIKDPDCSDSDVDLDDLDVETVEDGDDQPLKKAAKLSKRRRVHRKRPTMSKAASRPKTRLHTPVAPVTSPPAPTKPAVKRTKRTNPPAPAEQAVKKLKKASPPAPAVKKTKKRKASAN